MIKTVKLEELASVKGGKRLPKGVNLITTPNSHPYIRVRDLNNRHILELNADFEYVDDETQKNIARYIVDRGDIVLSIVGTIGLVAIVGDSLHHANLTENCVKLTQLNGVNRDYLYYFLKSELGQAEIAKGTVGAVQAKLPIKNIQAIDVVLPSLEQQEKIASILAAIDYKIEANEKINDNLQQQAYAYFLQLFIENADPSWHVGTIADLGTVVGGGTPSKAKPEYYTDDGIAWITPKDLSIDKSKFIAHGENDISELGYRNSSATMMPAGTVLFSSRAPIGYIAIASNEVTTNQGFKSVVPHPEIGTPLVYYFLIHNLPLIESKASGSTFKEVSGSVMKSVEAVIPDSNTIAKFNDFCRPVFEMQEKLEQENRKLAAMRDSLLPRLMSGEIDVADIGI